jgi:hypothetical protein
MENNRSNFEKNKYKAQIRGEQISNLEKEKSNNKLAEKIESGLNIHSMPNSFRAGKFNDSVHPNDIKKNNITKPSSGEHKHKYIGVLIVVVGILILGGIVYFLYNYITEGSPGNNTQVVQENTNTNNNQEDNQNNVEVPENVDNKENNNDEVIEDIDNEDNTDEEIINIENGTSTDEIATSTDLTNEDLATSTEEAIFVKDTDEDGLTDMEEHLLNTNINLEDSDSDGYNDASEVVSLYNPAGTNTLIDNPGISEYSNPLHNYVISYPQSWIRKINNEGDSVMFMNENEGFFQISVENNNESLSIEDWYRQQFNVEEGETLNYFSEDNNIISSNDGLFAYYSAQGKIFVFSYTVMSQNPGYPNIFKAFVNSFSFY